MQRDALVRVLDKSRDRIVDRWTAEANASCPAYVEMPEEEIRLSVEMMMDGLQRAALEGDYSGLFDLIDTIVPKRIASGVKLSDVQRIINIGTKVVLEELKGECAADPDEECFEAFERILDIVTWASMNLTDTYEEIRQKESISGTLTGLGAAQEEMDQMEILRRSLEFSVNLAKCTHGSVVMQHLGGCAVFFPPEDRSNESLFARLAGQTIRARKTITASEEEIARQIANGYSNNGPMLATAFGVPIFVRGMVRGALLLGATYPKTLSEHEIRFLESVSAQIGLACENARMIELLMHKAEMVKSQHDEILRMTNELGAMVYVADMDTYEILAANKPLRDTYGSDIVGKKCYEALQNGQAAPCTFCTNKHIVKDGRPAGSYVWRSRNSRTGRWYQCHDRAIEWTDGRLVRLEIALDVSEIESAKEQVDRMSDMITLYNSLLVHDITNHAGSAKGYIELLSDDSISDEKKAHMIDSALAQIGKIESLVDRVSKIVKAQTFGTERLVEGDLLRTMSDAVADARAVPGFEDVQFTIECDVRECKIMLGEFVHDIFLNLLTNAAKYGGGRPVLVRIDESTLRNKPSWSVSVIDQGPGIPPDRRDALFQPYERLATLSGIKGLGLGLTIVRALTDAYGGSIEVEDRIEGNHTKGSVFRVTFPQA